ncbi:MAG TPA: VOC family protein [Terriglobales bacterium]
MAIYRQDALAKGVDGFQFGSRRSFPRGFDMTIDIQGMTPLLQVFDMATSLKFYCDVLGFEIVQTDTNTTAPNHNWVWLRLNDTDLMLNTAYEYDKRPPVANSRRVASHRDTALFFGAPDVDAVYAYLRAKGIEVKEPTVAPYGMKQLSVRDPDGFGLCFQWKTKG